ncbi:MAG TPA: hypothetical protein VEP28_12040, partial [Rubrobacter sp.]|nr:hypothetical protein [Rubrobacter sp.]
KRSVCFVWIIILFFVSAPAIAGDVYHFTYERRGGLMENVKKGRVLTEGSQYRLELESDDDPRRSYDVLISKGAGAPETGLVLADRTFHEPKVDLSLPSSRLFEMVPMFNPRKTAKKVRFEVAGPEAGELSGLAVQRHEIRLSYDATLRSEGASVRGKVRMTAVFWMHEGKTLPLPAMLRPEIRTGFSEIDSQLTEELAKLRGLPLKQQITVNADVEDGIAQTDALTIEISGLAAAKTNPALFVIPQGFKFEEPVFVGPGMSSPMVP